MYILHNYIYKKLKTKLILEQFFPRIGGSIS